MTEQWQSLHDLEVRVARTPYERMGGSDAVRVVVERFSEAARADPRLAPYVEGVDLAGQRRQLALFLTQVLGGPREERAADLVEIFGGLHLTEAAYDRLVHHLGATVHDLPVPDDVVDIIGQILVDARALVVTDVPC